MTRPASRVRRALRHLAAALALAIGGAATAQELNFAALRPDEPHVVRAGIGLEDALVVTLGYGHVLSFRGRPLALTADVDMVPVHAADWRVRTGAVAPIASWGRWTAGAAVLGIVRNASNQVNTMTNVGAQTSLMGGFYDRRWFVAAEGGVDWATATYIRHSEQYRRLVYDGARDGWYSNAGASLVYGLSGGYSFRRFDLVARVGQRRDLELQTWLMPLYATLAINLRLPAIP